MNPIVWALVFFGTGLGLLWIGLIWLDVWLERHHRATISERLYALGTRTPLIAAFLGLAVGILIGGLAVHLWFPIYLSQ